MLGGAGAAGAQIQLPGGPAPKLPKLKKLPPGPPEPPTATPKDGPAFPVDGFDFAYLEPGPGLPALDAILPLAVELVATDTGYVAPREGVAGERVVVGRGQEAPADYHASAVSHVVRAMLARLHDEGLLGIYVRPDPADIDVANERDLRGPDDRRLRITIWVGRIRDVRTVAAGDRIHDEWKVDNPVHRKIRNYSPLHPAVAGIEDTTDLLDKRKLEDYLWRLNRHPGRQVEAALAASEDGEGITLDYRVYEPRPWNVYAQASNTGTERTAEWQTRFGYVNRQTTNRDDILTFEYLNAGGATVNGLHGAYDAPWFAPRRPEWMESSGNEPGWIAWADRSRVPWWGLGRLRWRVAGGWTRIATDFQGLLPSGLAVDAPLETNDWNTEGRLTYNFLQHRNLFVDAFAELGFRGVQVDNEASGNFGDVVLFQPRFGFASDRINQYSAFFARWEAEYATPVGSIQDYESSFVAGLGRDQSDPRWWVLRWDAGWSHFLEPLLFPKRWRDPSTPRSSTLSHEISFGFRGQYAFDYRLIPQSAQVIGGLYSVRGFPQGLAVGDNVWMGTAEYRFHIPRALPIQRRPMSLPWIGDFRAAPQQVYGRPDWDLILRLFVDAGRSERNRPWITTAAAEPDQTLVGAGVGLELIYKGNLRARVDWAHGILQNTTCWPLVAGPGPGEVQWDQQCAAAKASNIDPAGQFYFLLSIMY